MGVYLHDPATRSRPGQEYADLRCYGSFAFAFGEVEERRIALSRPSQRTETTSEADSSWGCPGFVGGPCERFG